MLMEFMRFALGNGFMHFVGVLILVMAVTGGLSRSLIFLSRLFK